MTVIPSCGWIVGGLGPNDTVETKNFTLSLSKTENFTFTLYVSNIGDAFAHILYYAVFFSCDSPRNYTQTTIPFSSTVVLKPHENTRFEYSFDPSSIPSEVIFSTHCFSLTFIAGSAETTIKEVVAAEFEG
jgi:hypothetical protein